MSRKRWMWIGAAVLVVAGLGFAGWSMRGDIAYAGMATGYAAKTTCSCRHVSGRTMESCLGDLPAEAVAQMNIREDGDRVHASVLLGAISAEAQYEDGYGCRLVN